VKTEFPYLEVDEYFNFPDPEGASPEGIVAMGGNLSPGMLLSAYRQGMFPWFNKGDPLYWWSPDPRFVLFPNEIHVSKSMKKTLRQNSFSFSLDTCFEEVITRCMSAPRRDQDGTWISDEMKEAYTRMHELGYAHSVEAWQGNTLCGGLYGISLGRCFFGESMFSSVSNASKAALITLNEFLLNREFGIIDCQVPTFHLASLGAREISRKKFYDILKREVDFPDQPGKWEINGSPTGDGL